MPRAALQVEDTEIELTWGQRYGLVGRNGCGKSTLLTCLANREVRRARARARERERER